MKFAEKTTAPATIEISEKSFANLSQHDIAFAYFGEKNAEYALFDKAARVHEDIIFTHSFDKKFFEANNKQKITAFSKYTGGRSDFNGEVTEEKLEQFIL